MDFKSIIADIATKLGNAGKVMTSKRVYATAATMFLMKSVDNPVAMICVTACAMTYIICETFKKS